MKKTKTMRTTTMAAAAWLLAIGMAAAAPAPDSKRMGRAKDFISDEQWSRAIVELQAAAADPKETNKDEALFWLAHSQHQIGDDASALQSIAQLERTAPRSPWVKPAVSLKIEIAQRLRRDDVLWMMVAPPAPPAPPVPVSPGQPAPPAAVRAGVPPRPAPVAPGALPAPAPFAPTPVAATPLPPPAPPAPARVRAARGVATTAPPALPFPPDTEIWLVPTFDMTLRVQALSSLVETHADQAIPLLREIALDRNSPDEARQAVFVLGQSRRADAQRTVVDVAHQGAMPVRLAAVRELGRFDGPKISWELMQVYTMADTPVRLKRQVVSSLGDRADNASLLRIVRSESEPTVRDFAIFTLGRTGAREQLRLLYAETPRTSRPVVLNALLSVKDDDELIRIARTEQDPFLRMRARQQLRLLATPKAVKFLEDNP